MAGSDEKRKAVNWSKYGGYYSPYRDYYGDDNKDDSDYLDYDWSQYSSSKRKTYSSSWWSSGKSSSTSSTTTRTTVPTTNRFSWGSAIGYSSSFRTGLSDDTIDRFTQLTNKALNLTREFISILALPFKVRIAFSYDCIEEQSSNYNSRLLFLSTKILDKAKDKDDEVIINTTVGLGLHETAHLMYSEFGVVKEFFRVVCPSESAKLTKFIFNLIEDERVEDLLLKGRPGYATFINTAREFKVEEINNNKDVINEVFRWISNVENKNKVIEIFKNLIYAIRFPSLIDEKLITSHSEFFNSIKKDLLKQPARTMDSCNLALGLVNKFLEYINNNILTSYKLHNIKNNISNYLSGTVTSLYTIDLMYGSDESLSDSDIRGKLREMGKFLISNATKDSGFKINLRVAIGAAEFGSNKKAVFYKNEPSDRNLYIKIKNRISKYIPQIKKKIKNSDKNSTFNIFGCRSGLLDTTKLVEAIQGVPQVYYRTGKILTNKTTVCILVDESGSMSWNTDCHDEAAEEFYSTYKLNRSIVAREAAILLNEALDMSGVDLYIYGHSADQKKTGNTELYVYKEPGYKNIHSMTSIQPRSENRDGNAIFEVARRIRTFTSNQVLMFVLSDGCPAAAEYHGDSAIKDTAKKVKLVENMGFDVVQVTISSDLSDSVIKQMFRNYIRLDQDLSELPQKLGQVIKKAVLDNKQTTVSF